MCNFLFQFFKSPDNKEKADLRTLLNSKIWIKIVYERNSAWCRDFFLLYYEWPFGKTESIRFNECIQFTASNLAVRENILLTLLSDQIQYKAVLKSMTLLFFQI